MVVGIMGTLTAIAIILTLMAHPISGSMRSPTIQPISQLNLSLPVRSNPAIVL
jgi:hypothetical protein